MENRSSGTRIRPASASLSGQCHANRRGIPTGSQLNSEEWGQSFRIAVGPVDAELNEPATSRPNKQLEQTGNSCVDHSNMARHARLAATMKKKYSAFNPLGLRERNLDPEIGFR
jgi:hypothetical protein